MHIARGIVPVVLIQGEISELGVIDAFRFASSPIAQAKFCFQPLCNHAASHLLPADRPSPTIHDIYAHLAYANAHGPPRVLGPLPPPSSRRALRAKWASDRAAHVPE